MKKLIIATRGSQLALWQSNFIKATLEKAHDGLEVELLVLKTTGDKILDTPLALIGGKGLFTKELEEAMLDGRAHMAVHSLKDVPTKFPNGLVLGAVTKREDARDCLLSEKYDGLDALPQGATVGTTSLRRRMQLLRARPDLKLLNLRGNVDTRIRKLKDGEFDAIVLATAGLVRLGLIGEAKYANPIDRQIMVPSMGQAALGIECVDDEAVRSIISVLHDQDAFIETKIERDFVDALNGGCQAPIGVNAQIGSDGITIRATLGMPDGKECMDEVVTCGRDEYETFGTRLADIVKAKGSLQLLERACLMAEETLKHTN